MTRFPNINAIAHFEVVARHSSVTLAASELMVSRSAVSQQIKSLEERMGVTLFRRSNRKMILTEEGEQLYRAANKALSVLRETQANISIIRDNRVLTIRTSPSFGVRWLTPLLAEFVVEHPHLDLRIDATSELSDFEKENIDLEIRYTNTLPEKLHCQFLVADHVMPLCAPRLSALARKNGVENSLASSRLIHTVKADMKWREWLDLCGMRTTDASRGLYFDRSSMSLKAAQDGLGVTLETATLAMNELRSGVLVPLAPKLGAYMFQSYWLICPTRHLNSQHVEAFISWLCEKSRDHEQEKKRLLNSLGVKIKNRPDQPSPCKS